MHKTCSKKSFIADNIKFRSEDKVQSFQCNKLNLACAGYYVNSSGVPRALRWLPRASLIKHAFEALCVNEFRGLEFDASEPKAAGDARTGEQV